MIYMNRQKEAVNERVEEEKGETFFFFFSPLVIVTVDHR